MPAERDPQFAGLSALSGAGQQVKHDIYGRPMKGRPAQDGAAPTSASRAPEHQTWPPQHPSWPPQARRVPEGTRSLTHAPDWRDDTGEFRAALSTLGPRKAKKLHSRLSRWKPRYWPLVMSFLAMLLIVGWFTEPYAGPLGLALTIMWTWPILTTLVGIRGIHRTRKSLRKSNALWRDAGPAICEDFLVVVVPSIGRHDTYPALERSIL